MVTESAGIQRFGYPVSTALRLESPVTDLTRMRLRSALDALGGVSKKKAKVLEREYRSLVDSAGGDA